MPLTHGQLPYFLCFTATGSYVQFFAQTPNDSLLDVSREFDVSRCAHGNAPSRSQFPLPTCPLAVRVAGPPCIRHCCSSHHSVRISVPHSLLPSALALVACRLADRVALVLTVVRLYKLLVLLKPLFPTRPAPTNCDYTHVDPAGWTRVLQFGHDLTVKKVVKPWDSFVASFPGEAPGFIQEPVAAWRWVRFAS